MQDSCEPYSHDVLVGQATWEANNPSRGGHGSGASGIDHRLKQADRISLEPGHGGS
jgi:hypothetical protein